MRLLLLFTLLFTISGCNDKKVTPEIREKVLLEEFDATKRLLAQSKYMTEERTNQWIKEFTERFKLDPKEVEKSGFQLDVINAKAMQLGLGKTISLASTWQLTLLLDVKKDDGTIERQKLPAKRSIIYLWEPEKAAIQPVVDSGFVSELVK